MSQTVVLLPFVIWILAMVGMTIYHNGYNRGYSAGVEQTLSRRNCPVLDDDLTQPPTVDSLN